MKGRGFDIGPLGFGEEEKKKPDPRKDARDDTYSPWEDASGEGWKDGASSVPDGLLSALKETAERDFDDTFRALVVKFLWDMFWSFVKPTKGSIDAVVNQIVSIGVDQVTSQYKIRDLEPESQKAIQAAARSSVERFGSLFTTPMLSKEFMASMREAFKKAIKK